MKISKTDLLALAKEDAQVALMVVNTPDLLEFLGTATIPDEQEIEANVEEGAKVDEAIKTWATKNKKA